MSPQILHASSLLEQLRRRSSPRLILEIDMRKRFSIVIAHNKAGGVFFDGPRRRKAAGGHR
jgi:hypothetical protein